MGPAPGGGPGGLEGRWVKKLAKARYTRLPLVAPTTPTLGCGVLVGACRQATRDAPTNTWAAAQGITSLMTYAKIRVPGIIGNARSGSRDSARATRDKLA